MTATPTATTANHCASPATVHVGYARSVPEVERWIELADLEDALRRAGAP